MHRPNREALGPAHWARPHLDEVRDAIARAASLHQVRADPDALQRVSLSLSVNARDAMPAGGALTISVRDGIDGVAAGAPPAAAAHGRYVVLSVADEGVGMDEATCARIFEPFFTTKPEGRGTGLGLAIVERVVRESGGFVTVASRRGEGTRFDLWFPETSV